MRLFVKSCSSLSVSLQIKFLSSTLFPLLKNNYEHRVREQRRYSNFLICVCGLMRYSLFSKLEPNKLVYKLLTSLQVRQNFWTPVAFRYLLQNKWLKLLSYLCLYRIKEENESTHNNKGGRFSGNREEGYFTMPTLNPEEVLSEVETSDFNDEVNLFFIKSDFGSNLNWIHCFF